MLREIILTQQMQYNKVWLLSQISDTRFPVQLTKQSERWPEAQKTHSYGFIYNLLKHSRKLQSLTIASVWKEHAAFWHGFCRVWFFADYVNS